jgi:uncharacterized protein YbgA (DUF1722 family)
MSMQNTVATTHDVENLGSVLAYLIGYLARHANDEERRMLEDLYKKFQQDMQRMKK